jgi:hypothetical protein
MLPLKVVQEIKRLLDEGRCSQRQIAQTLGVGRGTVSAIASGKRGLHGHESMSERELDSAAPVRCPGCGARVYLPCILCQARSYRKQRKQSKRSRQPLHPRRVA